MNFIKRHFFVTWKRTIGTVIVLLFGLYTLAGFIIIPWLVRPRIADMLAGMTDRQVRIDQLKFNPYILSVTIGGFAVTDPDGSPMVSLGNGYANLQIFPLLFDREIHLKELRLVEPYSNTRIDADGNLNYADLIERFSPDKSGQEQSAEQVGQSYHLQVDLLSVAAGAVQFSDTSRSSHFSTTISPINFEITDFHTAGKSDAPYAFSATTESGEVLKCEGFAALQPLRSKGTFEVTGLSLSKYNPFYDIFLNPDVVEGTFGIKGTYNYISGADSTARLENASATVSSLKVVDPLDNSTLLSLQELSVSGVDFDALGMQLDVQKVKIANGSIKAKRLKDGAIDLAGMLKQPDEREADQAEIPAEASPGKAFNYNIQSIELDGISIEFLDSKPASPVLHALDQLDVELQDLQSGIGAQSTFAISTSFRSGGSFSGNGTFSLHPINASMEFALSKLAVTPANPYLAEYTDITVSDGAVDINGKANLEFSEESPTGNFSGNVDVHDVQAVNRLDGKRLVSLTRLSLADIIADLNPTEISIGSVEIVDPRADVTVYEDGTNSLAAALGSMGRQTDAEIDEEPAGPSAGTKPELNEPLLPFPVTIGSVILENAGAVLTDSSVKPSVQLGLKTLSGKIEGLSSEELARADLDFSGELVGGTKLSAKGKINPLIADQYSDMEVSFKGFNLTILNPYSRKYVGYALSRGQLSFQLNYKISHAELSGENVMNIDQLTLGEKVDSEEAVNLPIPLAIALLQDKSGMIEIDVPVAGNLNDPEFSFGRVISRAVINILTKVITSPFSLLSNLASGRDDVDLSRITFPPGTGEIEDESREILELLAKALFERPNLRLDIIGTAGGRQEVDALKIQKLNAMLQAIRWNELDQTDRPGRSVDEIAIGAEERSRLIEELFYSTFPEEAASHAPVSDIADPQEAALPAEESADSPAMEQKGILTMIWDKIFTSAEEESTSSDAEDTDQALAEAPQVAEASAMESPEPTLSLAEMQDRILATISVEDNDLRALAANRAENVRRYLEETGNIGADRLFVILPEDESIVHPESGSPQVIFNLE